MTAPSASVAPLAARPRPARGAALLVVIVAIAILTAITVDLAYSTRVSLLTAANARDELRAEYLARGAVQLSRLVLKFQKQLDEAQQGGGAAAVRIQVWNLVPVTDAITAGLFGGKDEKEAGGAPGTFHAQIEDEGRKVNAQLDAIGQLGPAQLVAFLQLVGPQKWDPLFDREDANGLKVTRTDLAVNLHDWTDDNSATSAISTSGTFEPGFGDENQPYSRGDDPYQAKNARFDSLDELYLVAGIDDAFMTAFGSQLTVFPRVDGRININTPDLAEQLRNARTMAQPEDQPTLQDQRFPLDLLKAVSDATLGGLLQMRPAQFAKILTDLGVTLKAIYQQDHTAEQSGAFTDRSTVYRIRATGAAGAAERRVDAVVSFDSAQAEQEAQGSGRLLHWREE